MAAGADGVISVVSNAFPKQYSEMVRLLMKGDLKKARQLHYQYFLLSHCCLRKVALPELNVLSGI